MKNQNAIIGLVFLAIVFYMFTSSRTEVKEKSCGCGSKKMY